MEGICEMKSLLSQTIVFTGYMGNALYKHYTHTQMNAINQANAMPYFHFKMDLFNLNRRSDSKSEIQ